MAKKITILLIEDEVNLAILVSIALEKEGYRVLIAGDGAKGLEFINSNRPNLIILDILIPPPDGWEVLKRVRANPVTQKIPVLVLTTQGLVKDVDRAMALGATAYMVKPFGVQLLTQKIAQVLGGSTQVSK